MSAKVNVEAVDMVNQNIVEITEYQNRANNALELIDDIVLKNYSKRLYELDVVPMSESESIDNLILFKINKMVYEKDEFATDKFISVVSAMTYADNSSIYLIIDGKKSCTNFYLGVKKYCADNERIGRLSYAKAFESAIKGQFPGIKMERLDSTERESFINGFVKPTSVSSCVGVPAYKNTKGEYTNQNFIQGIEKFTMAMQDKEYTAIILATNISSSNIKEIRDGYEHIYTELSSMATQQIAYSTNESLSNALSRTKGYNTSVSKANSLNKTKTNNKSISEDNLMGNIRSIPIFGSIIATIAASAAKYEKTAPIVQKYDLLAKNTNIGDGESEGLTLTDTQTNSENFSETNGETATIGVSKNFTLTIQDKHTQEVLKKIDKQLERIEQCESTGLWSTGAYFISYNNDRSTSEIAATIFRSIMQGEQSGVEISAINTWRNNTKGIENKHRFETVAKYISNIAHPIFIYKDSKGSADVPVFATSLISSKELAMMVGLPRKSVPGLPVVELTSFAKEVVQLGGSDNGDFKLGCIFDQGVKRELNKVNLDSKSLTQHMFVTGSTGSGKSNTIYYLLDQIRKKNVATKFLIVEPAKGEYKNVFGDADVYGTNPLISNLLKINPFKFPKGIHVLEHIDKLIEIFNVCWPMYAAMPAILKDAMLEAYQSCGWNLNKSVNTYSGNLFPTFADLQKELINVINNSAYAEEMKSNYQGSLVTRVKSLANGLNGQIFSSDELGDKKLFDENVIVDLSRVGSQETKSLIMGIIIMRLSEYRSVSDIEPNSNLRHVTVLEEAHNILKKCSQDQNMEGSNVAGKSVEMISNAIAEMRTYGEGFIIVDQSPGAVDISAIRNTNTKIIMRLPEESDRRTIGKSAAMKDIQIDEIAKLPTGVAVVYQNNWEEPVLCQIAKFDGQEVRYKFVDMTEEDKSNFNINLDLLKFLVCGRVSNKPEYNLNNIIENLESSRLSTKNKVLVYHSIEELSKGEDVKIWKDYNFKLLSSIVSEIVTIQNDVVHAVNTEKNFSDFDNTLNSLINREFSDLPISIIPTVKQCVMREYSHSGGTDKRDRENIYASWFKFQNNKL